MWSLYAQSSPEVVVYSTNSCGTTYRFGTMYYMLLLLCDAVDSLIEVIYQTTYNLLYSKHVLMAMGKPCARQSFYVCWGVCVVLRVYRSNKATCSLLVVIPIQHVGHGERSVVITAGRKLKSGSVHVVCCGWRRHSAYSVSMSSKSSCTEIAYTERKWKRWAHWTFLYFVHVCWKVRYCILLFDCGSS